MSVIVKNHQYLIRYPKLDLDFDSIARTMIILQMLVKIDFKMQINLFYTKRQHISDYSNIYSHYHNNLKYHM
jgi:hypothetical protein